MKYFSKALNGGEIGLTISSAIAFMNIAQFGVKMSAELENVMISPEQVIEYTNLPSEAPDEGQ